MSVVPLPARRTTVTNLLDAPTVSVIVPVRWGSAAVDRCLAALDRLEPAPDEVVVVVDGGSTELVEQAAAAGAHVVVLPRPHGPSVARNRGAAASTGELLLFVDADVELHPGAVGRVRRWAVDDPGCGAVIGSYDDRPAQENFASQLKNLANHWYHQHARERGTTFWAACGAVRRSAFDRVGGFDERFHRPSVEDIDLGYRLRDAGECIAVDKGLQATHLKRWTLGGLVTTDILRRALPWSGLILRRGRLDDDLNVSVRQRIATGAALVGAAAVAAVPWWPAAALVTLACIALQLVLDRSLLGFLRRRKGLAFAVRSAPMLLMYHLYSALSFGWATVRHVGRWRGGPHPPLPPAGARAGGAPRWRAWATAVARAVHAHASFLGVLAAYALSAFVVPTLADVAIGDDGMYRRSAEALLHDGDLTVAPLSAVTQVFQTGWGAMFGLVFGDGLGVFTLSTVVLTALAGWACYGLCRELGVDRNRSALGAAAYLFNPLGYVLSFTFLTDAPLTALVVIAAYGYARGLRGEAVHLGWLVAGSAAAGAAFLVRQQGALVVVGVVCHLLASRWIAWSRAGARLLGASVALPVMAAAGYYLWAAALDGLPADTAQTYAAEQLGALPTAWDVVWRLTFVQAVYLGLFVLPVGATVVWVLRRMAGRVRGTRRLLVGTWALVLAVGLAFHGDGPMPYLQSFFTISGLGPAGDLRGGRMPIMGDRIGVVLTAASVIAGSAALLGVLRPRRFRGDAANDRALLVLWILGGQAAGVIATSLVTRDDALGFSRDRYLLPLLPLAVSAALWATREVRARTTVGWVVAAAFLVYSVAGTHDMLRREVAVWDLAAEAIDDGVPPEALDAGAGWASYHLYGGGIAQEPTEPVAAAELTGPLLLSGSDVPAWWIPFYAPGNTSEYVVSSSELELYKTLARREHASWLSPGTTYVHLLARDDSFR